MWLQLELRHFYYSQQSTQLIGKQFLRFGSFLFFLKKFYQNKANLWTWIKKKILSQAIKSHDLFWFQFPTLQIEKWPLVKPRDYAVQQR